MGRKKILIVDDEPAIAALLKAVLAPRYDVLSAVDGEDAMEQAVANRPDLIFSDLLMPRMDGYALLEKLKSHAGTRHIPTIILTAVTDTSSIFRAVELGASDYLMKPFQVQEVPDLVQKHI